MPKRSKGRNGRTVATPAAATQPEAKSTGELPIFLTLVAVIVSLILGMQYVDQSPSAQRTNTHPRNIPLTDATLRDETANIGLALLQSSLHMSDLSIERIEQVSLDGNDHLLLRLHLTSPQSTTQNTFGILGAHPTLSPPDRVIIKRFEPAKFVHPSDLNRNDMMSSDNYRHATLDYLREARALTMLNATAGVTSPRGSEHHTFVAPLSYGADDDSGTLVMQDLGGVGQPLYERFGVRFRSDKKKKKNINEELSPNQVFELAFSFVRIGEAMARLHDPFILNRVLASDETDPHSWLREVSKVHDADLFKDSKSVVDEILKKLNVNYDNPKQFKSETEAISNALLSPGPWLAFTHGDVCADNIFLMARNRRRTSTFPATTANSSALEEPMLIDYSSSGPRHSMADFATFFLQFPTCWCAGDIPLQFLWQMRATYRHTRLVQVQALRASGTTTEHVDLEKLENELSDTRSFDTALVQMMAFHVYIVVAEYWDEAVPGNTCGAVSCRSHIVSRLSAFLRISEELDVLPNVRKALAELYFAIRDSWDHPAGLPPFPSLTAFGNPRLVAARMDTRRLQAVTFDNALDWLSPPANARQVTELKLGPNDNFRDFVGPLSTATTVPRGMPVRVTSSLVSTWPAIHKWTSLLRVVELAAPDMKWSLKKCGTEAEGTTKRFPIGCCETVRLTASKIPGHESCVLNDCVHRQGLHSPVYASVLITPETNLLNDMPSVFKLVAGESSGAGSAAVDEGIEAPLTNVWASSKGSITPLHYDPFHNTFVQISGRKRFILIPPSEFQSVYLHPRLHLRHRQAQLNLNDPDIVRFPGAKALTKDNRQVMTVIVGPGEVLYVPPYWMHQVESLDDTVSVSVFTASESFQQSDAARDVSLPINRNEWSVGEITTTIAIFLRQVITFAFPKIGAKQFIGELLETRYDAVLFENALGPRLEPHHPDPGTTLDPHYAQFMHELIGSTENADDACLIGAENCLGTQSISSLFCKAGEGFVGKQAEVMEEQARKHAAAYVVDVVTGEDVDGVSANEVAVARMALEDFVEDMVALTVSVEMVHDFLQVCFR